VDTRVIATKCVRFAMIYARFAAMLKLQQSKYASLVYENTFTVTNPYRKTYVSNVARCIAMNTVDRATMNVIVVNVNRCVVNYVSLV
jgi:hypothetical protein